MQLSDLNSNIIKPWLNPKVNDLEAKTITADQMNVTDIVVDNIEAKALTFVNIPGVSNPALGSTSLYADLSSRMTVTDSSGTTYILGPTGPQGSQGFQGLIGSQGFQGLIGSQGFQGLIGSQGFQGLTGNTGAQGLIGSQGFQGLTGNTGSQGFQGLAGSGGATGSQGFQGLTGNTGAQGALGSQGFQGLTGSGGATGSQGFQGLTGTTGSIGSQGFQGLTGSGGATGSQGFQGLTGTTGSVGSQGFQGLTGTTGSTGSQGFQGLTGNTGAQGALGSQGFQGLTGATGSQGFQGLTGTTGSQGAQGTSGASIISGSLAANSLVMGASANTIQDSGISLFNVVQTSGSVTNNRIVVYSTTTGALIKDGGKLIADLALLAGCNFTGAIGMGNNNINSVGQINSVNPTSLDIYFSGGSSVVFTGATKLVSIGTFSAASVSNDFTVTLASGLVTYTGTTTKWITLEIQLSLLPHAVATTTAWGIAKNGSTTLVNSLAWNWNTTTSPEYQPLIVKRKVQMATNDTLQLVANIAVGMTISFFSSYMIASSDC